MHQETPPVTLSFDPAHVVIVLIQPQHPGNIGATCRAMKNMGLHRLRVVDPADYNEEKARIMAPGAMDVLKSMEIYPDAESALKDLSCLVATTARVRHWRHVQTDPRDLPRYLLPKAVSNQVGILFGREDFGLPNDLVGQCEMVVEIPTVGIKSLNLSQAVLIVAYELMMSGREAPAPTRFIARTEERERLASAVFNLAMRVGYQKSRNPSQVAAMFKGLLGRLSMDRYEIGHALGLIRKVNHHLRFAGVPLSEDVASLLSASEYPPAELDISSENASDS